MAHRSVIAELRGDFERMRGQRFAVADHAVAQLKERGDPWRLNEEAPVAKPPST